MKNSEVLAMVGKKVTLTLNGKTLNGSWEVEIVGLVTNNPKFTHHAKVLWKKPAMPDYGYGAKMADKKPEIHYVAIQALSYKGMEADRAKAEAEHKAQVAEKAKVRAEAKKTATPKSKKEKVPAEIMQALAAMNSLKSMIEAAGYNCDLE